MSLLVLHVGAVHFEVVDQHCKQGCGDLRDRVAELDRLGLKTVAMLLLGRAQCGVRPKFSTERYSQLIQQCRVGHMTLGEIIWAGGEYNRCMLGGCQFPDVVVVAFVCNWPCPQLL